MEPTDIKSLTNPGNAHDPVRILVALDEQYIPPLRVMLKSLSISNPGETVELYLMHDSIPDAQMEELEGYCAGLGFVLYAVRVDACQFADAPVFRHYSIAMYFRLLACWILPESIERILYIDPDTMVINPIRPLYEMDIGENLYAAASHTGLASGITENINRFRLGISGQYFNSGVLLMNLKQQRQEMRPKDIFAFASEHRDELVLPDQDILNGLYGGRVLPISDVLYNYDARNHNAYMLMSGGEHDTDFVMRNTIVLHFCGSAKPWMRQYRFRYGTLYKHYMRLSGWELPEEAHKQIEGKVRE